ncbi:uncharacterized protein LOC128389783 [Panonychus citri]|uniref:uncharacterized protein LOC128389783 n=1 Tax=Panonychus citri TaxID=50023 RepID=UPI0023080E67|nr:uncharacterized protein LOC128389783 [Panonychus citri]
MDHKTNHNQQSISTIMLILFCLLNLSVLVNGNHGHLHHLFGLSNRQKYDFAKKVAAALFVSYRAKKFLLPVPFPIPIPVPVFETYQPVVADPLYFKWLTIKNHIGSPGGVANLGVHGGTGLGGGLHGLG